jgi:membrane protease YdiL (CAAX protease family)
MMTQDRIHWLERPDDDFPYYRSKPVEIKAGQWWIVMIAVVVGFAILILPPTFLRGDITKFVPAILYSAIPLAALAYVAGRYWTAIFRPLRGSDFLWMIAFALLNLAVTLVSGSIINSIMDPTTNEAIAGAGSVGGASRPLLFARTAIQLFGEEVMSILPFLALMYWLVARRDMGRKAAIVVAAILVAVLFAVAHLHTYGWNFPQALIGVGTARIVLLLPYIMTKNLWVSAGAHILNDWIFLVVSILATASADAAGGGS